MPIKVAIIGCGTIANVHSKCLSQMDNCNLAAFADIKKELDLPIVCNCSGYESDEILDLFLPVVDVFLPDLKFFSPEVSKKYANCQDYFDVAMHAIKRMAKKT